MSLRPLYNIIIIEMILYSQGGEGPKPNWYDMAANIFLLLQLARVKIYFIFVMDI